MKQLRFFKSQSLEYGGSLSLGRRKTQRVLSLKKPLHLVLKSKQHHLVKYRTTLINILHKQARIKGVKIYSHSLQKDHWHLVVRITSRSTYKAFIRAVTGLIALRENWERDYGNCYRTLAFSSGGEILKTH